MHDTILLEKISQYLRGLCNEHSISKIFQLTVGLHPNSHVNLQNLKSYLEEHNTKVVGEWTKILIHREDIEEETAIIHSIKGE